jgi:hypothetical protein
VLRLPATHIRSLICFASGVHAILLASCFATCAPGRSEGTSGPGPLFNRRPKLPVRSHVDVNGTSQVPRRSILCLCPALRPRPNRRSLASLTVSSMLPPRFPRQELQRLMNFGALSRGFGTCSLRFKTGVATTTARLASGWLARLYRERVELSGSLQKVSDHPPPLLDLAWRKGSFMILPDELECLRKADGSANQISTDCSPAEDRIAAFDFGKRRHVPRATLRQRYTNSLFPRRVQCRPLALNGSPDMPLLKVDRPCRRAAVSSQLDPNPS